MPRSLLPRRSVGSSPRRAPARRTKSERVIERESTAHDSANAPAAHDVLFQQGIVAPHHKQALILAHAHARTTRPRPPRHHTWLYAVGMGFCGILLAVGWWFTVGTWIKTQMQFVNVGSIRTDFQRQTQALETQLGVQKPEILGGPAVEEVPSVPMPATR